VGAIHNDSEPYWLDSGACDDFIGYADHPRIPSIKTFWHTNVHPEVPEEDVRRITCFRADQDAGDGRELFTCFDANGYSGVEGIYCKNGEPISIPHCRECQVQPRCSKWNGEYPYGS
jgi:hypothetical protein